MGKLEIYPNLNNVAIVEHQDNQRPSPLTMKLFDAIGKCSVKKLQFLLRSGPKLDVKNQYGHTVLIAALHIPDAGHRVRMFKYLTKHGANPLAKDNHHGRNCLSWSCILSRCEEARYLLHEYLGELDITEADFDGNTALHHAILSGSLDIVRMLLEAFNKYRISVDIPDKLGLTPYMQARRLGHYGIAQFLKDEGRASPHRRDDFMFKTGSEWAQVGKTQREKIIRSRIQKDIAWQKVLGWTPKAKTSESLPTHSHARRIRRLPRIAFLEADDTNSAVMSQIFPPDGSTPPLSHASLPDPFTNSTDGSRTEAGIPVSATNVKNATKVTLTLMDMSQNGRRVKHFHKSQPVAGQDENDQSDINISSFLDVLADQKTASYRKAVVQPIIIQEIAVPVKKKPRVSSLAIVMGKRHQDRQRKPKSDRRPKNKLSVIEEVRPVSKGKREPKKNNGAKPKLFAEGVGSELRESSLIRSRRQTLPEIKV